MVAAMSLAETLIAVWQQVLAEGKEVVQLEGRACPVGTGCPTTLITTRDASPSRPSWD